MYNPSLSTAAWEAETHKQLEAQEDSLLGMQRGGQEALFLEHSPLKNPVPGRNRDFGLCLRERQQETTAIKCIVYLSFHSMFMGRSTALSGNVCAPETGTDQTANSRSPDIACLIISRVHVCPTSIHHRQILVFAGLPAEQLLYQGKGSSGGDFMTPGEGLTHQKNKWGNQTPTKDCGCWRSSNSPNRMRGAQTQGVGNP